MVQALKALILVFVVMTVVGWITYSLVLFIKFIVSLFKIK